MKLFEPCFLNKIIKVNHSRFTFIQLNDGSYLRKTVRTPQYGDASSLEAVSIIENIP